MNQKHWWIIGGVAAVALLLVGVAKPTKPGNDAKALLDQADKALQEASSTQEAAAAQQQKSEAALKLILSPTITADAFAYTVQAGDTLSRIARKNHTTIELLKIANGLTSDKIRVGQKLKVSKTNFSVLVDKSQNVLTLKQGEEVLKVYRCSTGKADSNTPAGVFKITSRIIDPPWYSPNGVIPPGDPKNLLGSRWLGFDLPGYGIHGTTDPTTIGQPVTNGCVRLANADVEELFVLLPEGTSVTIVE